MSGGDEGPPADRPPLDDEPSTRERPVSDEPSTPERPVSEEPSAPAGPTTDDSSPPDRSRDDEDAAGATEGPGGRREVEVPQSLFRIVTVFSTLLAVALVVLGFVVLDAATKVLTNPPGSLVVRLLALAGPSMETLTAAAPTIAVAVGLVGLALIVAGAGVYVYGSRFRAPGMGKPKEEAGEDSSDG